MGNALTCVLQVIHEPVGEGMMDFIDILQHAQSDLLFPSSCLAKRTPAVDRYY